MGERLAVNGGTPVIPPGTIKPWPPIDNLDRKMVMDSLEGGNHAFGPNCVAFQDYPGSFRWQRCTATATRG